MAIWTRFSATADKWSALRSRRDLFAFSSLFLLFPRPPLTYVYNIDLCQRRALLSLQENILGLEYSGTSSDGHRYMGICGSKAMASMVDGDEHLMWPVPESWSLEDAATVPVVYATVWYHATSTYYVPLLTNLAAYSIYFANFSPSTNFNWPTEFSSSTVMSQQMTRI